MTLPNKKDNHNDRISDLPCNVVDDILANLKIRDLVRTSVLSKKWRYMWTSAPHLCFDRDLFESSPQDFDNHVVSKIITDVLMLHNGPIHKFSIYMPLRFEFFEIEKLNRWIPFMSRDIKHLKLVVNFIYQMPDILFSCKELTYFEFRFAKLTISPNFRGFKKLLELHLDGYEIDSKTLESFLFGCPVLEKLSIEFRRGCDHLVISSPSLKVLVLKLYNIKSICLKKAHNLINFTLWPVQHEISDLIKTLPQIKKFSLTNWGKIPIADIIPPTLLTSSFISLEHLNVDSLNLNDERDILYFVSVLKSAPRLIELVIKQSYYNDDITQVWDHSKKLECQNCCLKLQLLDIYVRANSQHGMSLIQFILANSPLLKTFNLYSYKILDAHMLSNISKDLLWMKRASPKAKVKLLHPSRTSLFTL